MSAAPVRVGVLGCGTVGSAVVRSLLERADLYAGRVGTDLVLSGVAVRSLDSERDIPEEARSLLTTDADAVLERSDVLVELMGGIDPARELMGRALDRGIPVVTGNKQVIARHGADLHARAEAAGTVLTYEAAVLAAIPVLHTVRDMLAGDVITSIRGIMNGSTNYILDLVGREQVPFADALQQASDLGYLEADPTEDVEGLDAAAKVVVLARAAWGVDLAIEDVDRTGIMGLTDADFDSARGTGQVIRLIAAASRHGSGERATVRASVRPVRLSSGDALAQVRGADNAVVIDAESAGTLRLVGAGAGGDATASAVLGDLVGVARELVSARR